MDKSLRVRIFGEVQGVAFRYEALRMAEELDIRGFARNEPDGSVYIEAEAGERDLFLFLKWCRRGPALARVEKVEYEFSDVIKDFHDFVIA